MNGKQAKRLRKQASLINSKPTSYQDTTDSLWGPLPWMKDSNGNDIIGVLDVETLNRYLDKIDNTKFRGQGFLKQLRYASGKPVKLSDCFRKVYKELKKNYVEVAQGAEKVVTL